MQFLDSCGRYQVELDHRSESFAFKRANLVAENAAAVGAAAETEENDAERELRQLLNKATILTGPESNRVRELMRQTAHGGESSEEVEAEVVVEEDTDPDALPLGLSYPSPGMVAQARRVENYLADRRVRARRHEDEKHQSKLRRLEGELQRLEGSVDAARAQTSSAQEAAAAASARQRGQEARRREAEEAERARRARRVAEERAAAEARRRNDQVNYGQLIDDD